MAMVFIIKFRSYGKFEGKEMNTLNSLDTNYSYFQITDKKFHNLGTLCHPASRLVYVPSPLWMTNLQHIFNFVNQTNHPENIAMTKLTAIKKT